jgi:hypothetical protein
MNDLAGKVEQARGRLSLRRMMDERGKGPPAGKHTFACPYCTKPGARLLEKGGRQWFKCFHTSCKSGTSGEKAAWDEVGFLAYELGVSRWGAFKLWLKDAGVLWEEPPKRGAVRRSEYLPQKEEKEDNLPPVEQDSSEPEPWDPGPEPEPSSEADLAGASSTPAGTSRESLPASDGTAAVPDLPLRADGVTASPAASSGVPTPTPGEAAHFPATAETPGVTSAEPKALDAATPDAAAGPAEAGTPNPDEVQTPVEATANIVVLPPPEQAAEEEEEKEGDDAPPPVQAMRWLHPRLPLLAEQMEAVRQNRGLPRYAIAELGLRSSVRSKALLREMAGIFPMTALLASGLWTRGDRPSDEPRPNRFYFGWGPAGKRRGPNGEDEMTFDWTQPLVIPYRNRAGQVLDLRTHKWTQRGQSPRLYVPRRGGERKEPAFAVLTEGELKAAAIDHALAPRALAAGLPGITMSKPLWGTLVDLLLAELPPGRPVVVVFDNEDKGTKGLPGYKADWRKRHDSELWARYLVRRLTGEGFNARLGHLPNGWRDARGKADWDGSLALLAESLGRQEVLPLAPV